MTKALEMMMSRIEARHAPMGNVHTPEWAGKYLGGSTIVKLTAREYAQRVLAQKRGAPNMDDGDAFWAFKGNTIADGSLPTDDGWTREIEVHATVTDGWSIVIHPDGIASPDGEHVVIAEHKAFIDATDIKNERAIRQAALGLAIAQEHVERERTLDDVDLIPIKYTPEGTVRDHEQKPFTWTRNMVAQGVIIIAVKEYPPPIREMYPFTPDELRAILAYYKQKAAAIIRAIMTDDLSAADEWDLAHPTEETRLVRDAAFFTSGPVEGDLTSLVDDYLKAKDAVDSWTAQADTYRAELIAAMTERGEKRMRGTEAGVSYIEQEGRISVKGKALAEFLATVPGVTMTPEVEAFRAKIAEFVNLSGPSQQLRRVK